jgi:putative transposase
MSRIARVTAVNYPHHMTQRGNNQIDTFFEDNDRQFDLEILKKYAQRYTFDIWAYWLDRSLPANKVGTPIQAVRK